LVRGAGLITDHCEIRSREVFKPNAKSFFAQYSDLVTKKRWTSRHLKHQKKVATGSRIASAWAAYQKSVSLREFLVPDRQINFKESNLCGNCEWEEGWNGY
jgi:hypothetical protein